MLGRSWVEIDLNGLKQNYINYKSSLFSGQEVIAVVKANAYGHGDVEVAKALESVGVSHFAVATIEEGVRLRRVGVKGTILILSYTPISCLEIACKHNLMQTIISEEYAYDVCKLNLPLKVQIAIDTGMNRIGLKCENVQECIFEIKKYAKLLQVVGVFTHLSSADSFENRDFTQGQIERFKQIAEGCRNLSFEFVHCLNSLGGVNYNDGYLKYVRLGMLLYGLENVTNVDIKPVLQWKSVVSMVKAVKENEYVGYGTAYKTNKSMVIATIPTGYADGYSRRLSNKGSIIINGKKASIIGKICMDQFMVDASDCGNIKHGDEVVLLGDGYSACDMAKDVDGISYEIPCFISSRVARIYKE